MFTNGMAPVYSYDPPPGYQSIGGLPTAVLYMVFNKATGNLYYGAPLFLPCLANDQTNPTQVTCPNNPPTPIQ
jgi:hypothetical protein